MKNCLVIDLDRCSGCDSCVAACKLENSVDLGVNFNRVSAIGPTGAFPDIEMYWRPVVCQQCANPGCISVCPTGASYRDEEAGVVLVNADECIGCKSCILACPYSARALNPNTGIVEKCTLCFHRRHDAGGWVPACVHNCCTGARYFGDLDDPNSDASKALAAAGEEHCHRLPDKGGLEPSMVYILSWSATWQEGLDDIETTRYEKK